MKHDPCTIEIRFDLRRRLLSAQSISSQLHPHRTGDSQCGAHRIEATRRNTNSNAQLYAQIPYDSSFHHERADTRHAKTHRSRAFHNYHHGWANEEEKEKGRGEFVQDSPKPCSTRSYHHGWADEEEKEKG